MALAIASASLLYAWHRSGGFDRAALQVIELQSRFAAGLERFVRQRFRRAVKRASVAR